jgi:proteasome lid subunit RPN8/RPN11
MPVITLREIDIATMYTHGEQEYPSESCGVVIGDINDPTKNQVRPCRNIQNEMKDKYPDLYERGADTGYFMDPKDVRQAFEDASKQKLAVIGFYHSHPDHEVYWSGEDYKAAMWAGTDEPSFPDASNIVVSVMQGKAERGAIFTWNETDKTFERTDIGK